MNEVNSKVESFRSKVEKAKIFQKILSDHHEHYFQGDDLSIIDIINSLDLKSKNHYNLKTIYIPVYDSFTLAIPTQELSLLFKVGCDKYLLEYTYNKKEYPIVEKFVFLYDANVHVSHVAYNQDIGMLFCVSSHLM